MPRDPLHHVANQVARSSLNRAAAVGSIRALFVRLRTPAGRGSWVWCALAQDTSDASGYRTALPVLRESWSDDGRQ